MFLTVFAFLFSHFDIVCWTYHIYIIIGFCLFLSGFIFYIKFLKSGTKIYLIFTFLSFLIGLFCYETFIFWPLGIIFLSYVNNIIDRHKFKKYRVLSSYLFIIGFVYFFYFISFISTVILKGNKVSLNYFNQLFTVPNIIFNFFGAFFNLFYNGFLINLIPNLAFPLIIDENLNLGGILANFSTSMLNSLILLIGGIGIVALTGLIIYLFKRKYYDGGKIIIFFLFLSITNFFILFHFRSLTNPSLFNLTQFRFLYISNALLLMIILYLISKILIPSKKGKIFISSVLFLVLVLNIYAIRQGISILDAHLNPLSELLSNIKKGIKQDKINERNKIYLDDNIAKMELPPLCWNKEMGELFMEGTYEWFFTEKERKNFDSFKEAKWVINNNLKIVKKSEKSIEQLKEFKKYNHDIIDSYFAQSHLYNFREIEVLNLFDTYVKLGELYYSRNNYEETIKYFRKSLQLNPEALKIHRNLAQIYVNKGKYDKAIEHYKKVIEINPKLVDIYDKLGDIYKRQGKYDKAIEHYKKAIEINPKLVDIYDELGDIYKRQGKHDKAIEYYKKVMQFSPDYLDAYRFLAEIYFNRGDYKKAVQLYNKMIEINPEFTEAYMNLGHIYSDEGKYTEAIKYFKKVIHQSPQNANAHYQLGEIYYKIDDKKNFLKQMLQLENIDRKDLAIELEGTEE